MIGLRIPNQYLKSIIWCSINDLIQKAHWGEDVNDEVGPIVKWPRVDLLKELAVDI